MKPRRLEGRAGDDRFAVAKQSLAAQNTDGCSSSYSEARVRASPRYPYAARSGSRARNLATVAGALRGTFRK
jgi:hypothetical protein